LGEPLCPACYDAEAQVLWNGLAPELWRRTTIAVYRALGRLVGLQEGELRRLVRVCWTLGGPHGAGGPAAGAWAHMLGFRGHWSAKSRRYPTTFTVLRRARVQFAKRRRASGGVPLDAWDRPEDDQAVTVVASWVYVGSGYAT
jgi:hypothetical protein